MLHHDLHWDYIEHIIETMKMFTSSSEGMNLEDYIKLAKHEQAIKDEKERIRNLPFEYWAKKYVSDDVLTIESYHKMLKEFHGFEGMSEEGINEKFKKYRITWKQFLDKWDNYFIMADLDQDGKLVFNEGRGLWDYMHRPHFEYTGPENDVDEWSRQAFKYTDYDNNGFMSKAEAVSVNLYHDKSW